MKLKLTIVSVLTYVFVVTGCSSGGKHKEKEHALDKLLVTTPIRKDTTLSKEYVCQIHSIQHIELRALEGGYLEKIYVDEGQRVKEGDIMFQIMPLTYKAEFQKAVAEVDYAQVEFNNAKLLADSNIISKNQLLLIKAKLDKAKAEKSLAKVHLNFTQIKAPFDGIMDRFQVRLGSLLEEGELLSTLSDNSQMWVYFNVPESEYLDYKSELSKDSKKMKVQLRMANDKLFNQEGIVETIEADFNNETGNIAFRATFLNPSGLLRHGETGNIITQKLYKEALLIPQKSTFEILQNKYVYVIDKNNIVKSRRIEVEAELPDIFIVKSGLKESDKILLEGLRKVKENDKITYELKKAENVISNLKLYAE